MLPCLLLTSPHHPDVGPALNLQVALKKPVPTGDKGTPIVCLLRAAALKRNKNLHFFRAKTSILHCRVGSVPAAGWIFCKQSKYSQMLQSTNPGSLLTTEKATRTCSGYLPVLAFTTVFFPASACWRAHLSCGLLVLKNPAPPIAVRLYPTWGSHFWVRTPSVELCPMAYDEGTS